MTTPLLVNKEILAFDVRNILTGGSDPLKEILQKFKTLRENQVLCIINGFVPLPLIRLLEGQKAKAYTETIGPGEYHTYFIPEAGSPPAQNPGSEPILTKNLASSVPVITKNLTSSEPIIAPNKSPSPGIFMDDQFSFESACATIPLDTRHDIDVRALEMPQPMQDILTALERLPKGHALYVFHKRVPVHLLEDLAEQSYEIHITTLSEKDVRLLIIKR